MDAGRFDVLSRSLDVRSRRGAFRALGLLGAVGLVDRLGVTPAEARKKKGGKKKGKKDCEECICPVVSCPTLDTCPGRTGCVCGENSATPGCRFGKATADIAAAAAVCNQLCGSRDDVDLVVPTPPAGQTLACNTTDDNFVIVGCPI
jgi:hypothetical protein